MLMLKLSQQSKARRGNALDWIGLNNLVFLSYILHQSVLYCAALLLYETEHIAGVSQAARVYSLLCNLRN